MKELRDKLRAKLNEARAIVEKAKTETRGMTAEEKTQYDAVLVEVNSIKDQISVHERSTELEAELGAIAPESQRTAADEADRQARDNGAPLQVEVLTPKYESGDSIGALICARHRFGQDKAGASRWAERQYGSGSKQFRTMQASNFTAGGATIAENFVGQELIELLRAKAAVRRAGARELPLVNGSATLPKITGGSSAYWGDENDNIRASEMTTGQVKLVEKKLTALVPFSNDLLKNSNLQVDRMIRDDVTRSAANAEDIAFLKGPGTASQPKGIYYWVGAAGRGNSAGDLLADIRTDVKTAKNRLGGANAPKVKRAWFMNERELTQLGTVIADANSNLVWPALAAGDGAPWQGGIVYENNNIETDLNATTDSEIYYVEMSECFIGDSGELEIELFANATYVDAAGNLRSGVSRDESVIRLIRKTDFAMRHAESAFVLEQVSYGA